MKRLLPVCVMILCLICSGFTAAETENTATYLPGKPSGTVLFDILSKPRYPAHR